MRAYRLGKQVVLFHGTKLKKAREAARKTLEDVAEACGVTRQAVGEWEQGESNPRNDEVLTALIACVGGRNAIERSGALEVFK